MPGLNRNEKVLVANVEHKLEEAIWTTREKIFSKDTSV